jgi:N-acetylmuramoyl-L-alanine amidase
MFTLFTPRNIISGQMFSSLLLALQSTPDVNINPTPIQKSALPRIGIVSGHYGHDSGTVCKDGLTEASVNMTIATLVRQNLLKAGFQVDLLQEFDPNLNSYQALALISIHNDSCDYINDQATGFKVASAQATRYPEKTQRLAACLTARYAAITKLPFHANTITVDMSQYHAFDEINPSTPAVIIETGFMNLDRQILTAHPDVIAQGITAGLFCFINNEIIPTKEAPIQ